MHAEPYGRKKKAKAVALELSIEDKKKAFIVIGGLHPYKYKQPKIKILKYKTESRGEAKAERALSSK